MGMILNLVAKLTGVQKILDWLDGAKTYISGAGLICAGLAVVLSGASALLGELAPLHSLSDYLAFGKGLAADPNVATIVKGWATACSGLAVVGLRHAIQKGVDGTSQPPSSSTSGPSGSVTSGASRS